MSFYLQVATETADIIERGDVQEGSATNHSDFERFLGLEEHKKKQKFLLEQKRNIALEELEDGRRKRAQLREQMQHLRNEKIIEAACQKKDEATKHRQEQTLRDRLNAALSKNAIELHQQSAKEQALLHTDPFLRFRAEEDRIKTDKERFAAMKRVHGNSGSDLLRRFIEGASAWNTRQDLEDDDDIDQKGDSKIGKINNSTKQNANPTKMESVPGGESPAITVSSLPLSSNHPSKKSSPNNNNIDNIKTPLAKENSQAQLLQQKTPSRGSTRSLQANVSNQTYTPSPSSIDGQSCSRRVNGDDEDDTPEKEMTAFDLEDHNKNSAKNANKKIQQAKVQSTNFIPLTSMIRPELRVPTAANLVSNGYGRENSKTVCTGVYNVTSKVEATFKQLDDQDKRDFDEWNHRRQFYYRERSGVLEQMKAEGFFRRKFTDDAAPKIKQGAILGHEPRADKPAREAHPIDTLHSAVRDTVYEMHSASDTWKVVMANELTTKELTGAERAANITMMNFSNARRNEEESQNRSYRSNSYSVARGK